MKKSLIRLFVISVVGLLSLSAYAQPPAGVPQVYREGFSAGCSPITSLDTGCAHRLDAYVNEPLVAINWLGELQPMLAESYEMLEDGKVWRFNLREGVNWHDGEPFTASDAVWSINAYADPDVNSRRHVWTNQILGYDEVRAGEADSLEGVREIDEYTVEVELSEASPIWLNIRGIYLIMLPEHILGQVPSEDLLGDSFWQNRVGTGPFVWTEFVPDQFIELTRNEDYYLGTPILEQVILQLYTDPATMLADLERGAVDTTWYESDVFSPSDARRLDEVEGIDVLSMDKGSPLMLRINHDIFSDERVRQAMRYAIDVDLVLDTIYFAGGQPAGTIFVHDWAIPDDLNMYEYNPDLARDLLAEAGWDSSQEIELAYQGGGLMENIATILQQFFADVGINAVPRQADAATMADQRNNQTLGIHIAGYGLSIDPSIGDASTLCGNPLAGGYCNPELEELWSQGASLADGPEREAVYQEISRILNTELPSIWLWYEIRPIGFNRRVVGPYEHWSEQASIYFNLPVYNEIHTWYVQSE